MTKFAQNPDKSREGRRLPAPKNTKGVPAGTPFANLRTDALNRPKKLSSA